MSKLVAAKKNNGWQNESSSSNGVCWKNNGSKKDISKTEISSSLKEDWGNKGNKNENIGWKAAQSSSKKGCLDNADKNHKSSWNGWESEKSNSSRRGQDNDSNKQVVWTRAEESCYSKKHVPDEGAKGANIHLQNNYNDFPKTGETKKTSEKNTCVEKIECAHDDAKWDNEVPNGSFTFEISESENGNQGHVKGSSSDEEIKLTSQSREPKTISNEIMNEDKERHLHGILNRMKTHMVSNIESIKKSVSSENGEYKLFSSAESDMSVDESTNSSP